MSTRVNRESIVQMHGPVSSRYWHVTGARRDYDPVLIIGGAFQTKHSLVKFAEVFAQSADVVLVDLPGTGKTDILPAEVGVDFFADCIAQLLDQLKVTRVNLVGVSLGSTIAYTFAQRQPDRVANLVLIGTISHADAHVVAGLEAMLAAVESGDQQAFADRVSAVVMNHEQRDRIPEFQRGEKLLRMALTRMADRENQQFLVNGRRILIHRRLDISRPVRARTLVFTGEFDSLTTPEHCREVAESIDHAHLVIVREADHLLPLERFDVTVALTDSFLRGKDPQECPEYATVLALGPRTRNPEQVPEQTAAKSPRASAASDEALPEASKPRVTKAFSPRQLPQ